MGIRAQHLYELLKSCPYFSVIIQCSLSVMKRKRKPRAKQRPLVINLMFDGWRKMLKDVHCLKKAEVERLGNELQLQVAEGMSSKIICD